MPSREGLFRFYWNEGKRKLLVEKYGTNIKDELRKRIEADILGNTRPNIAPEIKSIDNQIKNERLKNLRYKNRIDKVRAQHYETFGIEPSTQANEAIKIGTRSVPRDVTSTYSKPITARDFDVRHHCTTSQNSLNGWLGKCKHCDYSSLPQDEETQALAKLKEHVSIKHYSEVWK
jgi:hypothetical protein